MKNEVLFKGDVDIDKENFGIIFLLILFLVFKIFNVGIYPFILGNSNLYLVFKPLVFYVVYFLITFIFNKNIKSYYIITSLIISFITPVNIDLYIFVLIGILANFINYLVKDKISTVSIMTLMVLMFDISFNHNYYFNIIYIFLCLFSFVYLFYKRINKELVSLGYLITIVLGLLIKKDISLIITSNIIFSGIFIASDNKYSPVTTYSQVVGGILLGIINLILIYFFHIRYSFGFAIIIFEILTLFINYLSVKFYGSKFFKKVFLVMLLGSLFFLLRL